jgi:hypothetical protein
MGGRGGRGGVAPILMGWGEGAEPLLVTFALQPKGLGEQFLLKNLTIFLFLKSFYFFFLQYYSKKK